MINFTEYTIPYGNFLPRAFCQQFSPWVTGASLITDILIFLSYIGIGVALYIYVYKKYPNITGFIALVYGLFITLCGINHLLDAIIIFMPIYDIQAHLKIITAVVSVLAAYLTIFKFKEILFAVTGGIFGVSDK